jgi:uncharacterized protein YcbK (DUF882 family)
VNVSSVHAAPASAHHAPATHADDAAPTDVFAQLFATLLSAAPAKPAPVPVNQADGMSDLDAPEKTDKAEASDGASDAHTNEPVTVVTSLAALDPQLQAKLSRVVDRVREETGHDVTVAETFRAQSRQNRLFAQGRSAPGEVVTWTQHSKHTEGRAVDVQLDGGAAGSDAYRALQRIANEEGLATLGPRDPGHLELRGRGPQVSTETVPAAAEATITMNARPPRPAPVNGVAQVAEVAHVAKVAQVAQAQMSGSGSSGGKNNSGRSNGGESRSGYEAVGVSFASRNPATAATTPITAPAAGTESMARAERVMAIQDSAPARSLSQITMQVDAGNGATDRVHVSMRGASLSTTIDTADARAAQVMSTKTDELARALNKQGVELESVRVRTTETASAVTGAAASRSADANADAYRQSRFDRGDAWQQQQNQHERNRSQQQRNQHEERQQREQRQQRGSRT